MSSDPTPGEPSAEEPSEEPPSEDPPVDDPADEATACAYTDYVEGEEVEEYPATGADAEGLAADVWDVLHDIDDPEMPVSIVDLGLIYGVDVAEEGADVAEKAADVADEGAETGVGAADETEAGDGEGAHVTVEMTLTYTGCPARKYLTEEITESVAAVDGVGPVDLELVWSPPWTLEMVTADGREDLREFGLSV